MLDRTARKNVADKKTDEAMANYYQMLESDPELAELHSNIGVLFMNGKKMEEAAKSLAQALKLAEEHKDQKAQFLAHYNLGVLFGSQKKVPEALEHYQAALEIVPTSKETKHNIELLIQSQSGGQGDGQKKESDPQNKDDKQNDSSKDDKDNKDKKDKKDQKQQDQDKKDDKDGKDKDKDGKDKDKDKEKEQQKEQSPKEAQNSPKYKPRPFKGDQLSEGDVKKILGELKNQEQKIRANFEKKERKENRNEKDW